MTSDLLRYALAAAARGWPVFPLVPNGKTPLKDWDWTRHHTTDPDAITRFWGTRPYNYGIATGPAGLVVLDLDIPKPGQHPPPDFDLPGVNDGTDALAVLCEHAGQPLPFDTFTVRTRRGGTHLYFTPPDGAQVATTAGRLGWLIDTRATGGYVVGPGSHVGQPDGTGPYEVIRRDPVAVLPGWLAERLTPAPLPAQRLIAVPLAACDRRGSYLHAAVTAELERVTSAPAGARNTALYRASVALGQLVAGGALAEQEVTAWLADAAHQVGQRPGEAARTIASGMGAGTKRPRTIREAA